MFTKSQKRTFSHVFSNKFGIQRFQRSKSECGRYFCILFSWNTKHLFCIWAYFCYAIFFKKVFNFYAQITFWLFFRVFLNGLLKFTPISFLRTFFTTLTWDSHKLIFVFLFVLGVKLSQWAFERPVVEESSFESSSATEVLWILNGGVVKVGIKDWNEEFCFWYFLGVFCNKLRFTMS